MKRIPSAFAFSMISSAPSALGRPSRPSASRGPARPCADPGCAAGRSTAACRASRRRELPGEDEARVPRGPTVRAGSMLSTGTAARGTSAAATARRRPASRARRPRRAARSGPGSPSRRTPWPRPAPSRPRGRRAGRAPGRRSRRRARRPAPATLSATARDALGPRRAGELAQVAHGRRQDHRPGHVQGAVRLDVLDLDVALPVDLDPGGELALGEDAEAARRPSSPSAWSAPAARRRCVRLLGSPRRAASACHSSE